MWHYFALVGLFFVWVVIKDRMIVDERKAWAEERRELLTRIQHPEVVQIAPVEREIEVSEPDELALVGQVIEE